jgi:ribose 5-phosphate isomerase A
MSAQPNLQALAERALTFVRDGMTVGLGSGKASTAFIEALGERVREGLSVRGIATSQASEQVARRVGVPLVTLDDAPSLDVTCDGADEVDPEGNCIKGYGAALVREKVVASVSRRLVILVGSEKLVGCLGARGKLPVEVVPFAAAVCQRRLGEHGLHASIRQAVDGPLVTDNGNWILDCATGPLEQPQTIEDAIRAIPGVVGTGLFLGMSHVVLVERDGQVEERRYRA